jgi:hypothetical protein
MDRNFVDEARHEVIPNVGQIPHDAVLALERAVRKGELAKWRGRWFPIAGAPFGIGPLKTCYGPPGSAERWSGWGATQ